MMYYLIDMGIKYQYSIILTREFRFSESYDFLIINYTKK